MKSLPLTLYICILLFVTTFQPLIFIQNRITLSKVLKAFSCYDSFMNCFEKFDAPEFRLQLTNFGSNLFSRSSRIYNAPLQSVISTPISPNKMELQQINTLSSEFPRTPVTFNVTTTMLTPIPDILDNETKEESEDEIANQLSEFQPPPTKTPRPSFIGKHVDDFSVLDKNIPFIDGFGEKLINPSSDTIDEELSGIQEDFVKAESLRIPIVQKQKMQLSNSCPLRPQNNDLENLELSQFTLDKKPVRKKGNSETFSLIVPPHIKLGVKTRSLPDEFSNDEKKKNKSSPLSSPVVLIDVEAKNRSSSTFKQSANRLSTTSSTSHHNGSSHHLTKILEQGPIITNLHMRDSKSTPVFSAKEETELQFGGSHPTVDFNELKEKLKRKDSASTTLNSVLKIRQLKHAKKKVIYEENEYIYMDTQDEKKENQFENEMYDDDDDDDGFIYLDNEEQKNEPQNNGLHTFIPDEKMDDQTYFKNLKNFEAMNKKMKKRKSIDFGELLGILKVFADNGLTLSAEKQSLKSMKQVELRKRNSMNMNNQSQSFK